MPATDVSPPNQHDADDELIRSHQAAIAKSWADFTMITRALPLGSDAYYRDCVREELARRKIIEEIEQRRLGKS